MSKEDMVKEAVEEAKSKAAEESAEEAAPEDASCRQPREAWPLARVLSLVLDEDGPCWAPI